MWGVKVKSSAAKCCTSLLPTSTDTIILLEKLYSDILRILLEYLQPSHIKKQTNKKESHEREREIKGNEGTKVQSRFEVKKEGGCFLLLKQHFSLYSH